MGYFTGRVAVITGAGSGIGRALAVALADQGSVLALSDRDAAAVEGTRDLCRRARAVVADTVDVTDRHAMADYADKIVATLGHVDAVFAVAGVIHTGSVLSSEFTDIEHVMNVDYWGVVNTAKAFLPQLIATNQGRVGHVVPVSSAFGLVAAPSHAAYCSAKFAVRGFTEALRQEMSLGRYPVVVTGVYPGGVRTAIMRNGSYAADEDRAAVLRRFDRVVARTEPADAAATILRGVRAGRAQVLVGADARVAALVARALGTAYQRVLPALLRRMVR
ncbi:Short-chain dehydrogenase [Amycolatopsis arida]|uniref:Short-chain dehydrogenase n=1 Tax=Amycolatopsis arida TaxID=587909 RepID=A0A1I6AMC6_9PSEU|nr:SDR family NAD(P)-dependent oxidoreductase [Amycolatopsis arida]TDX87405.1 short-subunit dehydrogenase [Amycolatopsis arida]SFQ69845.1 Short-chain dehydrogenase [Amycolatopsis arida]